MNQKTLENLMAAFAGESQANRKYLAFAKKAEEEGYPNIARLFRSAAEAETIHALKHLEVAGKIGSTLENLKAAVAGETYEFTEMYPEFIKEAEASGENNAARSFTFASRAEEVHARLYQEALKALEEGKDVEGEFYICPVCGNIEKARPERCPICGVAGERFFQV
ncbi:rubrerythrin family protein [Carboxydothermus ferrireducens]|uniref:Rubrerythrin n=1 Tax=Carboxydothermus ferrireducens DSM 11255 TaxID=1119529 RepID=A0ABX2R8Y6_9THEO|nr:rubrerythrin family protein [Carboxydothermus ferrireducens]NYE56606.1 rubrerythrin [Carboxydothermus ferrireducens DSM 11255]